MGPPRNPFDQDEDALLTKYIAVYNPDKPGRLGNALYKRLVENADNKWSWSRSHSWQSWRDRYKKNEHRFDAAIKKYQQKRKMKNLTDAGTNSKIDGNGAANGQPNESEPRTKKERTVVSEPSSSSHPRTSQSPTTQHSSRKDIAITSYLEAEEAGITSDEENHGRQKVGSQGHRHIARKTARKTAVLRYSEDEEEGDTADRVASGQDNAIQGKRRASEEFGGDDAAKRRRIQDEVPKATSDQKSLEIYRSANGSGHHRNDSSPKEEEHERSQDPSRRTSFTATVDLSRDLSGVDVQLNPTDKARITSAGLQFFIKSMAQNHGISEDWVWKIFRARNDLKATDHILAQMEAAARRACLDAMERDDGRKIEERTAGVPSTPKKPSVTGRAIKTHKLSSSREIDLTAIPSSRDRSVSRKRLSELQYTPGEEDPTFAHLRDQYAPPSASRAARYIRTRARRSSGMMGSPSNPNVEGSLRYNDEDSEKEEMEVTKALTPGRLLERFLDSSAIARANRDSSPSPMNMRGGAHTSLVSQRPWSADEDRILLDGEDGEAINEITSRRGRLAVKGRMVELNNEDSVL